MRVPAISAVSLPSVWKIGVTGALTVALLLGPGTLHAQSRAQSPTLTLAGQVLDEQSGEPVRGAVVELLPTQRRVVTDSVGRFELRTRPGDYIVVVSQLGYGEQRQVLAIERESSSVEPLHFRLTPQPLVLEGLRVIADRFASRRNSVPMSSRVWDRTRLVRSPANNLAQFIRLSGGVSVTSCAGARQSFATFISASPQGCIYTRGQVVAPQVYIDDRRAFGMDELEMYMPTDLHHLEVYGRGQLIRAYTVGYVESVASGRRRLPPMMWW